MAIASEKKETAVNLIPDKLNSSYSQGHMSVIFPRIPLIGSLHVIADSGILQAPIGRE